MSATPRVRLGVDVDNVLANSSGKAVELLNERLEISLRRDELTVRPFHLSPRLIELGVPQDEVSKALDDAWRFYSSEIKLMEPALPLVMSNLMDRNVGLHLITTMGDRDHSIRPNLQQWLHQERIPFDTISFVSTSAEKVAYRIQVGGMEFPLHMIVDDEQKLAIDLAQTGRPGLVYDAPWNRDFVRLHQADTSANGLVIPVMHWKDTEEKVLAFQESLRAA